MTAFMYKTLKERKVSAAFIRSFNLLSHLLFNAGGHGGNFLRKTSESH